MFINGGDLKIPTATDGVVQISAVDCTQTSNETLSNTTLIVEADSMPSEDITSQITYREVDFKNDYEELLPLYANAFEHQRQYINVTQLEGEKHIDALKWLFRKRLQLFERFGNKATLLLALHDGKIIAAGGIASNSVKSTEYDFLAVGLLIMPFLYGFDTFMRVLKLGGSTVNTIVDPLGGKIMMMAVEPSLQGHGIGGKLLDKLINDWDSEDKGELLLLTQLESSTKFYSKFGFELTGEVKKEGYSNWSMRRKKPQNPNMIKS